MQPLPGDIVHHSWNSNSRAATARIRSWRRVKRWLKLAAGLLATSGVASNSPSFGQEVNLAYGNPATMRDSQSPIPSPRLGSNSVTNTAAEPAAAPAIKYPTVQINGVLQADAGFFHQSEANKAQYGTIQDGADFRRVRLSAKGAVSEVTNYFVQMDFGFFGRPTFTDVWMETTDLPVLGNVRIGQWKQPFSLEVVSSFRYTTFMERSTLFQPFTPFRHLGIGFYDQSEDLRNTWAASILRTGQDQFGGSISTDGGWGSAERLTWLPFWDEASNGRSYLHLGAGHFYNNPPRDTVNFRSIPEIYIGENGPGVLGTSGQAAPGAFNGTPFFAQTGPLAVSQYNVFGGELLWVSGPLSLQSEAMVTFVQQTNGGEATLPGAYAQVGYFLTGEHRPYDRKAGAIDRVIPHENFFRVRTDQGTSMGTGAWEVAARVSWLDLEDPAVRGGTLLDGTLGVNWYLNPYSKLVFNYVHSVPDPSNAGASAMNAFAVRAQLDF
jgi:phosphate-selective porin OprO/OprP